jgi:cysteinyl-tRNA synthetase
LRFDLTPQSARMHPSPMKKVIVAAIAGLFLIAADAPAAPAWSEVQSWVYQLCNYRNDALDELAATEVDLAVVDLSRNGASDYFTANEIGALKASGKIVLAYFEIAAIEEYRPEWSCVPADLKAGAVDGWPKEQYVTFWDERWWPIVQGRIDQALKAGFDGAYLDMVTTYDEIPKSGLALSERARRMVDLIAHLSAYAKERNPDFKIVPQNCPELFTGSVQLNPPAIDAIDGLGMESVFYLAHDKPANKAWCEENRQNAQAIRKAGKLVLGIDYAKKPATIADAYAKQRALGFVPFVSIEALDRIPARVK